MREMGLAFDANQVVKIPSTKQRFIERAKGNVTFTAQGDVKLRSEENEENEKKKKKEKSSEVIRALESEAGNEDGRRKTRGSQIHHLHDGAVVRYQRNDRSSNLA